MEEAKGEIVKDVSSVDKLVRGVFLFAEDNPEDIRDCQERVHCQVAPCNEYDPKLTNMLSNEYGMPPNRRAFISKRSEGIFVLHVCNAADPSFVDEYLIMRKSDDGLAVKYKGVFDPEEVTLKGGPGKGGEAARCIVIHKERRVDLTEKE